MTYHKMMMTYDSLPWHFSMSQSEAFVDGQEPQKVMTHKAATPGNPGHPRATPGIPVGPSGSQWQVGDYFGELSLISNAPRAASIVTSSNVQVGRLHIVRSWVSGLNSWSWCFSCDFMNSPLFKFKRRAVPHCQLMSMDRKTFKRLMGPIVDILQREARLIYAAVYVGSSHPSLFSERHPGWCFLIFSRPETVF